MTSPVPIVEKGRKFPVLPATRTCRRLGCLWLMCSEEEIVIFHHLTPTKCHDIRFPLALLDDLKYDVWKEVVSPEIQKYHAAGPEAVDQSR